MADYMLLTNEKFPELAKSSLRLYNHQLMKIPANYTSLENTLTNLNLSLNAQRVTLAAIIHYFTREKPDEMKVEEAKSLKDLADYELRSNFKPQENVLSLEEIGKLRKQKIPRTSMMSVLLGIYLEVPLRDDANLFFEESSTQNWIDLSKPRMVIHLNKTKTIPKWHNPKEFELSEELSQEINEYIRIWSRLPKNRLFNPEKCTIAVKLALKRLGIEGGINYLRRSWRQKGMENPYAAQVVAEMMGHELKTSFLYDSKK